MQCPVGFYVELSLGPPSPPCPTWSPAFRHPRLTHADPAPHLASIWGWYSRRGEVTSGGEIGGPQGASDPQERVSEPLKRHDTCCWLVLVLLPGAPGKAEGQGLASPSLSQGPASCPAPQAALPFGGQSHSRPLRSTLTPKPQNHSMLRTWELVSLGRPWLVTTGSLPSKGLVLIRIAPDPKVKKRKGKGCREEGRPSFAERPHEPGASWGRVSSGRLS